MSTTAQCSQCHQPVTIPSGTPFDAVVCCPLCRATYPLRDLLLAGPSGLPGDGILAPTLMVVQTEAPAAFLVDSAEPQLTAVSSPPTDPSAIVGEDTASASPQPDVIVAEVVALPPDREAAAGDLPADPGAVIQEVVTESAEAGAVIREVAAESTMAEAVVQEVATESAAPDILAEPTDDESPSAPDPAPAWSESCDGASVAGALMDLWKEAGVAPPLDVPETAVSRVAPTEPEVGPTGYDAVGVGADGPTHSVAPARSYAARARAEEQVTPKKLVRVVGMMVSGLLAVLLTYGAFKLFGWGTRGPHGASAGTREAAKPKGEASGEFVPDWKGLKQFDGK